MSQQQITAVVFDLGGVLLDWNPRHLYRRLFADPDEMEDFLARICTPDWHHTHDLGEDVTQSCRRLARQHPRHRDMIMAWVDPGDEMAAGPIDDRMALRLARIDAWFGILAALVVAAGVLRVFFGAKGYECYLVNVFFWAKMALFVGVALLSVAPTYLYLAWRRQVRADPSFRPPTDQIAQLRQVLYVEAGLFALIPLCAAAMARGYGM